MLTLSVQPVTVEVGLDGDAHVVLRLGDATLDPIAVNVETARALGAHLGEDLELVLRVPGAEPPEPQETPCADREAGGGPDQPRTVTNTPGRAAPARASKGSKRSRGPTIAPCDDCGETQQLKAKGLCNNCYQRRQRDKKQRGKRRSNLRRLVDRVGRDKAAGILDVDEAQVDAWLADEDVVPGDVAQTLAHTSSAITRGVALPSFSELAKR